MIELFLTIPMWLQIFCFMCMIIGLIVLWKFRTVVIAVALGAIAIFVSIRKGKK